MASETAPAGASRSPLRSLPLRGNAAVAEHKRASARAVRCGHRKPDGGCAARRRRRGALPLCFAGILQTPAGPCPASVGDDLRAKSRHFVPVAFRNAACGRQCSHRPANPAMPQPPSGGRNRPPYKAPASGRRHKKRQPFAIPAGGPMQASAPTQRGDTSRLSSARHACCPPVMPPVYLAL